MRALINWRWITFVLLHLWSVSRASTLSISADHRKSSRSCRKSSDFLADPQGDPGACQCDEMCTMLSLFYCEYIMKKNNIWLKCCQVWTNPIYSIPCDNHLLTSFLSEQSVFFYINIDTFSIINTPIITKWWTTFLNVGISWWCRDIYLFKEKCIQAADHHG